MFGQIEKRIFRTGLHAQRLSATKIAFKGRLDILVKEDSPKGTGDDALLTGDALLAVDIIDSVLRRDGSRGTVLHALGHLALPADNRHPYDRVRIDDHHSNGTFFGVVHSETVDGADQFTDLASGASFRYDG
jgi:hypothetical protein